MNNRGLTAIQLMAGILITVLVMIGIALVYAVIKYAITGEIPI